SAELHRHARSSPSASPASISARSLRHLHVKSTLRGDTAWMPQEWKTSDIGERWFKEAVLGSEGGDPSLMSRLRDLIRLAGVIVTGVLSRRPVQPLGDEARRQLPGDELVSGNATQWTNGVT